MKPSTVFALALLLSWTCVDAQEVRGVVIDVPAPDRVVLRSGTQLTRVTLANITVPRSGAPLREASWQALRELCHGKVATLVPTGTAPDGSTLAEVSCAAVRTDEAMLRAGMAEVLPHIGRFDSMLRTAQAEARSAALGIWARQ